LATIESKPDAPAMDLTEVSRERLQTDHLWTAEDLLDFQNSPWQHELIHGVLYRMPPTGDEHGYLAGNFFGWLFQHVKINQLGELFAAETGYVVQTNPDSVIAPDCSFISKNRWSTDQLSGKYLRTAPDLVAEVVSPNDRPREVQEKVERWLQFGVRAVVVIDPKSQTVTVNSPSQQKILYGPDDTMDLNFVVPGFTLPIHRIFQG
jgi:Uma2 family endonuclease